MKHLVWLTALSSWALAQFGPLPGMGQPLPNPAGGQVYQNPALGLVFPVPQGFQLAQELPQQGGMVVLFLNPMGAELYAFSQPLPGPMDLQAFHQYNLQLLAQRDQNLAAQGGQATRQPLSGLTLAGRPALGVYSQILYQGQQYLDLAVYTVEGNRVYAFQLTAPAQVFPQVQPLFQQLLAQARIAPGGQAPFPSPSPIPFPPSPGPMPPGPSPTPFPPGPGPVPPGPGGNSLLPSFPGGGYEVVAQGLPVLAVAYAPVGALGGALQGEEEPGGNRPLLDHLVGARVPLALHTSHHLHAVAGPGEDGLNRVGIARGGSGVAGGVAHGVRGALEGHPPWAQLEGRLLQAGEVALNALAAALGEVPLALGVGPLPHRFPLTEIRRG